MIRISNGDADLFYLQKNFKKRELLKGERSLNKIVHFLPKRKIFLLLGGVFVREKMVYYLRLEKETHCTNERERG